MLTSAKIMLNIGKSKLEKGEYERRKTQVSNVKNKIASATDGNVGTINTAIQDISSKLESAISGISEVSTLTQNMNAKKEDYSNSEAYLVSYDGKLASEIQDCDTKISNLETKISNLNKDYHSALDDEKKEREELAKQIFG